MNFRICKMQYFRMKSSQNVLEVNQIFKLDPPEKVNLNLFVVTLK